MIGRITAKTGISALGRYRPTPFLLSFTPNVEIKSA
jgi:hypothetical protein